MRNLPWCVLEETKKMIGTLCNCWNVLELREVKCLKVGEGLKTSLVVRQLLENEPREVQNTGHASSYNVGARSEIAYISSVNFCCYGTRYHSPT